MKNECKKGNHKFAEIYSKETGPSTREVVRWCVECGSVVVDADCDGRTNPGHIMNLKSPKIAKEKMEV